MKWSVISSCEYGWSFTDKSQKYEANMNAKHTKGDFFTFMIFQMRDIVSSASIIKHNNYNF